MSFIRNRDIYAPTERTKQQFIKRPSEIFSLISIIQSEYIFLVLAIN